MDTRIRSTKKSTAAHVTTNFPRLQAMVFACYMHIVVVAMRLVALSLLSRRACSRSLTAGYTAFGAVTVSVAGALLHMCEPLFTRRLLRRVGVPLVLTIVVLSGVLGDLAAAGLGLAPTAQAHSQAGRTTTDSPSRFDAHTLQGRTRPAVPNEPAVRATPPPPAVSIGRPAIVPMQVGTLDLLPGKGGHFRGSDGRLEVTVPAGAVSSADVSTAALGHVRLRISQVAAASGSTAGRADVSLGTYLFQVVDGHGVLATHGLRTPMVVALHYDGREGAFDLDHVVTVINGGLPFALDAAPTVAPSVQVSPRHGQFPDISPQAPAVTPGVGSTAAALRQGPLTVQRATHDRKQKTLTTTITASAATTSTNYVTNSPVATFGQPDPFSVDLNAGGLTANIPLDVPAGPGGLTPPVRLNYSSASVSQQHSWQAPASWVGEGWNLSLGSISWAQHDVQSNCGGTTPPAGCGACQPTCQRWEDTWQLSDAFGTSAQLLPPDLTTTTYYDNTPNPITPSPVRWRTTPETYAKIYSYTGALGSLPDGPTVPPCFRVFLTNGIMEEFGCTAESLQYYYTPQMGDYIANWYVDLITDPQGNQIHITYKQDKEFANGHYFIRDVAITGIDYDSPGCHNAQVACTGAAWAPLVHIAFNSVNAPTRRTGAAPTNCNTGANLRCDDPLDETASGGLPAPQVESTFALDDVAVQVGAARNPLRDYRFSYDISGPDQANSSPGITTLDPLTGKQASLAGHLLLTQMQMVGADNTSPLPMRTFSYEAHAQWYEDSAQRPTPSTYCGPSWNTGNGSSGCVLWEGSNDGNRYYLRTASNGLGLSQTFTWFLARNNTHGVPTGATQTDPFYCTSNPNGYPCNEADDQGWSTTVLVSSSDAVQNASSTGNTVVAGTTNYSYVLTTLAAKPCSDCVVGMYWGNINDGNYLEYYDGTFMGFAEADVVAPDGAKTIHKYVSTEGWGIWDSAATCTPRQANATCSVAPWWDVGNAAHGRELETDVFDTNGTTLLRQTTSQYRAVCPSNGATSTPASGGLGPWHNNAWVYQLVSQLSPGNPVALCDVQLAQTVDSAVEGSTAGSTAPTVTKIYSYDSYGRPSVISTRSNGEPGLVTVEAETATVVSASARTTIDGNCCNLLYSNGAVRVLRATAVGQAMTLSFSVPSAGTYNIIGLMVQSSDCAIASFAIDGTTVGGTFDDYSNPANMAQPVGYGQVTLTAGPHQATWTAVGKNAASTNYAIDVDALLLQKTGTTPAVTLSKPTYIYNDTVSATSTSATGTYLIENTAFSDTEDAFGARYGCSYTSYDGQNYATGQQSTLTLGEMTKADTYTNCGTSPAFTPSGAIETTHTYDAWGNQLATKDPDANAGVSSHLGCTINSAQFTACKAFDSTFETLPTSSTNALNQTESTSYGTPSVSNGFGLWPITTTDKNAQNTTYSYDPLGRMIGRTLTGEGASLTTTAWSYTFWCATTGAQAPCIEVDQTQRLNSATTVVTRAFYDGFGDLVETRGPGPGGQDVVRYTNYDAARHDVFDSISYFVTAYTGAAGAAAYSTPDATQVGTTMTYDGAGRPRSIKDPLSHIATTSYAVACNVVSADGTSCYVQTKMTDALSHQSITYTDALGHKTYDDRFTGNSGGTYALYARTSYAYDYTGNLVTITHPNTSTTTTFTYDRAGRMTGQSDPDRGTASYTLDANGNRTQSVDARGASGTVFAGYDGLDRQIWRNSTNSSSGAYITYSYDSIANGNNGVGHITGESFIGGPNNTLSGSYAYVYDARGQQTSETETVGGTGYTVQTSYDDGGNVLAQTYPTGEVVSNGYTAQGWLAGVSTRAGTTTTTLLNNATYGGVGGAGHLMTGASLGSGTYTYSATYDALLRLSDVKVSRSSDSATLFEETRGFDNAGNVATLTTTLPQGTDVQAFCYDEQNRLTWASSATGSVPCGGTNTAGTLSAGSYTQPLAYDNLGRLTTGPAGTGTYGDSAHVHAVTSTSGGYTASYDAAGNMTCRAPTSATTCSGTLTGAPLGWDAEGRLNTWQSAPASPASTDGYLYDGEGNRVEQQVTTGLPSSPVTTTSVYVGNLEEIATNGSTTNTTTYYYAGTLRIAMAVNGTFNYLATDALGSSTVAFNASGTPVAAQLYAPYGAVRYTNGTMPGSYGFVGQHSDSATGLDYFNARYYDPAAGQFVSADTALPGMGSDPWALSRYAYVEGNPLIRLDPTGHDWFSSLASAASSVTQTVQHVASAVAPAAVAVLDATTGIPSMIHDVQTIFNGNASTMDRIMAAGDLLLNVAMDVSMVVGVGEGLRAAYVGAKVAGHVAVEVGEHVATHAGQDAVEHVTAHAVEDSAEHAAEQDAEHVAEHSGTCAMSFAPETQVAAPGGKRIPIVALKVGDQVLAYDTATGQTSTQTVQHVWLNHDRDLLDVTLRVADQAGAAASATQQRRVAVATHGLRAPPAAAGDLDHAGGAATTGAPHTMHDETIHTTSKHPWLTQDRGWVFAGNLHAGERVVREDGEPAEVVAVVVRPGAADFYNLTVSVLHTYAVGAGQYVVHNVCGGGDAQTTHQTYTVTNEQTGEVYSGRTSGRGSPEENIQRRFDAGHERTGNGWGDPMLDRSSTNREAIRGREQQLVDYYRSQGIAADQINGISPRNSNWARYMNAALEEFGPILEDPRLR